MKKLLVIFTGLLFAASAAFAQTVSYDVLLEADSGLDWGPSSPNIAIVTMTNGVKTIYDGNTSYPVSQLDTKETDSFICKGNYSCFYNAKFDLQDNGKISFYLVNILPNSSNVVNIKLFTCDNKEYVCKQELSKAELTAPKDMK